MRREIICSLVSSCVFFSWRRRRGTDGKMITPSLPLSFPLSFLVKPVFFYYSSLSGLFLSFSFSTSGLFFSLCASSSGCCWCIRLTSSSSSCYFCWRRTCFYCLLSQDIHSTVKLSAACESHAYGLWVQRVNHSFLSSQPLFLPLIVCFSSVPLLPSVVHFFENMCEVESMSLLLVSLLFSLPEA